MKQMTNIFTRCYVCTVCVHGMCVQCVCTIYVRGMCVRYVCFCGWEGKCACVHVCVLNGFWVQIVCIRNAHTRMRTHKRAHTLTHTHLCTSLHTHTHTHKHTHTCTPKSPPRVYASPAKLIMTMSKSCHCSLRSTLPTEL